MSNEHIQISGISTISDYPDCQHKHPCKEFCETDKLCIPCQKPDIKDIIEIVVSVSITCFKIICTSEGKKLIIDGLKHIKLLYSADKSCESVHCAHFEIPFCQFILLTNPCDTVACIKTAIEHISVHKINCRDFAVSTIILLCPICERPHYDEDHCNPCDEDNHHKHFTCNEDYNSKDCDCSDDNDDDFNNDIQNNNRRTSYYYCD